jgi:hypothetical protein
MRGNSPCNSSVEEYGGLVSHAGASNLIFQLVVIIVRLRLLGGRRSNAMVSNLLARSAAPQDLHAPGCRPKTELP